MLLKLGLPPGHRGKSIPIVLSIMLLSDTPSSMFDAWVDILVFCGELSLILLLALSRYGSW